MKAEHKRIITRIGNVLSILALVFIVRTMLRMGVDLRLVCSGSGFYVLLPLCIGMKMLSVVFSGLAWGQCIRLFAATPIRSGQAVLVYARANIGKYIPGNVMHFVQRNIFAADHGVTQTQLAMSTLLEALCNAGTGLLVALLPDRSAFMSALYDRFGEGTVQLGMRLILGLVLLLALGAGILLKTNGRVRSLLQGCRAAVFENGFRIGRWLSGLLRVALLQVGMLLLLGLAFVLLEYTAGIALSGRIVACTLSVFILAWVLGFIVPGAGGGIGIREMVLVTLLAPVIGAETVLPLAVVHRAITVVGDVFCYLAAIAIERKRDSERKVG